jgi:hypothetical protein
MNYKSTKELCSLLILILVSFALAGMEASLFLQIAWLSTSLCYAWFLLGYNRPALPAGPDNGDFISVGHCHHDNMVPYRLSAGSSVKKPEAVGLGECPAEPAAVSCGPTVRSLRPYFPTHCDHNRVQGLASRVAYDIGSKYGIAPDWKAIERYKAFVIKNFSSMFGKGPLERVPTALWLSNYDPGRQQRYAPELSRIEAGETIPKGADEINFFLKWEPYLKADGKGVLTRVISMKHPYLSACIGPMMKALSSYLKNSWTPWPQKTPYGNVHRLPEVCYVTGMTRDKVGKVYSTYVDQVRAQTRGIVAFNSDMSGYDSTQTHLIDIHRYVCARLFELKPEERWALKAGLQTKGISKTRCGPPIRCVAHPQLHTGSQGTSIWNTSLRVTTSLWALLHTEAARETTRALMQERGWTESLMDSLFIPFRPGGLTPSDAPWLADELAKTYAPFPKFTESNSDVLPAILRRLPYRLMALGDDNCTITSREIATQMAAAAMGSLLGMKEKIEVTPLVHADFLSASFVPCLIDGARTVTLTAKLGRSMVKTFYRRPVKMTPVKKRRYALGILEAYLHDHTHIRWCRILCERILSLYPKEKAAQEFVLRLKGKRCAGWEDEVYPKESSGFYDDFVSSHASKSAPVECPETREWYLAHYDLSEAELQDFENYCSIVTAYNPILDHPVLDRIARKDLGLAEDSVVDPSPPLAADESSPWPWLATR